ncbi:hypothetical protein [Streptomyces sp. B3I8]|uniref:hypothetical protein n=1 Tax=Streptomyces sp. B3I8 TaxID=3042303 RepID=UPI0027837072|nr:hypothetical protein [Streptomyces sp. B3I8]MDQ0785005.1 hypothetical protein [Streptomyces sp. B3I8]
MSPSGHPGHRGRHPGPGHPFRRPQLPAPRPDALYAYAAHSPHPEVVRRRDADFFALDHRRHADSVVVASTGRPQAAPRWATLPEDHVLEIRRGDLSAVVHGG